MEDGQTHSNVCRSMKLRPSAVSTIMKTADKIEQSMQHAMTVSAIQVSYGRSILLEKMEKLLSLWADDLNKTFCSLKLLLLIQLSQFLRFLRKKGVVMGHLDTQQCFPRGEDPQQKTS